MKSPPSKAEKPKAFTWGVRQYPHMILTDYEQMQWTRGPICYVFINEHGERYAGTRADVEFLIEVMNLRLQWLKDDAEPSPTHIAETITETICGTSIRSGDSAIRITGDVPTEGGE